MTQPKQIEKDNFKYIKKTRMSIWEILEERTEGNIPLENQHTIIIVFYLPHNFQCCFFAIKYDPKKLLTENTLSGTGQEEFFLKIIYFSRILKWHKT